MHGRAIAARIGAGVAVLATVAGISAATCSAAPVTAAEDALARVRTAGELRWGADAQGGAPYVFQDPTDPNHLIGFEVDLADALARELGVRARPIQGHWETLLALLARGDFDVALNGIEVAPEKERVCRLSRPYYAAAERLTVRRNDAHAPASLDVRPRERSRHARARSGARLRTAARARAAHMYFWNSNFAI